MNNIGISITVFFIGILILWVIYNKNITEGFMSPCPNCGKRNKMQCFQCSDCGWCVTSGGWGECVPGNENGPYFRSDCAAWQYHPHPIHDSQYYQPGWRRWWWWKMPERYRDRLRHAHSFRPPVIP